VLIIICYTLPDMCQYEDKEQGALINTKLHYRNTI